MTTIFVTHDQEEALEVSDRVVVMNHGKIEQTGSPQQVWSEPASAFVVGFLGDVNQFKGPVHQGYVQIGQGQQSVQVPLTEGNATAGAAAIAYVRPYDFEVQRYASGQSGIAAQLVRTMVVGPLARMELVMQSAGEGGTGPAQIIEAQIPTSLFEQQGFAEGDTLLLTPRKAKVFLDGA